MFEIEASEFRAETVSPTFHGRDLFAPAAARLASGAAPESAGRAVADPVLLAPASPESLSHGIVARVMLVDHFGNLVTNLPRAGYEEQLVDGKFTIRAGAWAGWNRWSATRRR